MKKEKKLETILDIGLALSMEKDKNKLFSLIISKSMEITGCDAGTLYIVKDNHLEFKIMKTLSQGIDKGGAGEKIDIPPAPMREENVCAYSAIHKRVLNIEDVYSNSRFDFSGPKRYDKLTGYLTKTMLTVPLVDADDVTIGVLQMINAMDAQGKIVPFSGHSEKIIKSLASLAAIALSNMQYKAELKAQMWSFTEAMATAIDERTPYNANHTRKVAEYSGKLADYINKLHKEGKEEEEFSENRKEQLVMATLLHDIGKLVTPLGVMNKSTRLNGREVEIEKRLERYGLKAKVAYLEGEMDKGVYENITQNIDKALKVMNEINNAGFLDDGLKSALNDVIDLNYDDNGELLPFFTEDEKACLQIEKGTLTYKERKIMEQHVEVTAKILDKVHFINYFANAPRWAAEHHELLDGTGYPNQLKGEEIALESRIIAVADICDALLATDRPYKEPMPKEAAFKILRGMASSGKIDTKLVEYLYECID